jgi:hypothetical protein
MYKIVNKSSGIVAYSTNTRANALMWLEANNFDEQGNDLNLYTLVKEKKQ